MTGTRSARARIVVIAAILAIVVGATLVTIGLALRRVPFATA